MSIAKLSSKGPGAAAAAASAVEGGTEAGVAHRDPALPAQVYSEQGPFRAPRGTALSCRGWGQEAALRMLLNNLDPEVAERPEDLVVYGGTGRAARSHEALAVIVRELLALKDNETLLEIGRAHV